MTNSVYESMAAPRTARAQFTILLVEDDPSDTELILHAIEQAELKAIEGELKLEVRATAEGALRCLNRSEEHTSELQSRLHLVCRLLLEKKKKKTTRLTSTTAM